MVGVKLILTNTHHLSASLFSGLDLQLYDVLEVGQLLMQLVLYSLQYQPVYCGHISNQIVFYLKFYNMLQLLGLEKIVILHI